MRDKLFLLIFIFISCSHVFATERANIVVAKDGTGNFTTIQAAVNSIDTTNSSWITILVKKGTYRERVIISKNYIAIVGESRDSSIIVDSIPRNKWATAHKGSTTGTGTISIGVSIKDTTTVVATNYTMLANLTIRNLADSTDYTHVIRGENSSNKIITVYCNVWCKGKDTHALWDQTAGMYYQANNSYRGYVDAVCPRGWSYDIGSLFYETVSGSPIWHEGVSGSGQKFVIRSAHVDGATKSDFTLNNSQGSAFFYFLDCRFSKKVKDEGSGTCYYYNTKSDTTFTFMADNITEVKADSATALWTFNNVWDPEDSMPAVLPFAAIPQPRDSAYNVTSSPTLKWIGARNANSYNVYFGTTKTPSLVSSNQTATSYSPGALSSGTTYYWRVDAVTSDSTITGAVWRIVTTGATGVEQTESARPTTVTLSQNYPNPFNPTTTFVYAIPKNAFVSLKIFDMLGREVATVYNGHQEAGIHRMQFSAAHIASGMYYARVSAEGTVRAIKFIVAK